MLLRYIVSNFKSIGHPMEFSMLPAEGITDQRWLKTITTRNGEWNVLCRGGFFGPNASGKSSFIESIRFARDIIVNGRKSGKGTGITQFAGKFEDMQDRSTFQFVFSKEGEVYDYGFTLDRWQVYEEWLMQMYKDGFQSVFTRGMNTEGETEIEITNKIAPHSPKQRELANVLKESIQEKQKNQLFLNKLSENGIKVAERVVDWFWSLQIIFPGSTYNRGLPIRMWTDDKFHAFIRDYLCKLDTGVSDITTVGDKIDLHEFADKNGLPSEIVDEIEEMQNGYVILGGRYFFVETDEAGRSTVLIQMKFTHQLNGREVQFDMNDESDGTKRLMDLLPMLFDLDHNASIYFVDEIDRSLHTKLSQTLLQAFVNHENRGQNQIIFTAHDVNLINLNSLRQDEIWFIEKNVSGESTLKPMSDFYDVTEAQDSMKSYLAGRFGAVPEIREGL